MSKINMNKVVGDTFEDMSITEMTLVQGSGDDAHVNVTTSPACVYLSVAASKASSRACAGAISAIGSAISGAVVSAVKC